MLPTSGRKALCLPIIGENVEVRSREEVERVLWRHLHIPVVDEPEQRVKTLPNINKQSLVTGNMTHNASGYSGGTNYLL